jgi:hypothetical protein
MNQDSRNDRAMDQLHLRWPPLTNVGIGGCASLIWTCLRRFSETSDGPSEEISQICVAWGKAVALSRLEPPIAFAGSAG